jgi:hypothetical protein
MTTPSLRRAATASLAAVALAALPATLRRLAVGVGLRLR